MSTPIIINLNLGFSCSFESEVVSQAMDRFELETNTSLDKLQAGIKERYKLCFSDYQQCTSGMLICAANISGEKMVVHEYNWPAIRDVMFRRQRSMKGEEELVVSLVGLS